MRSFATREGPSSSRTPRAAAAAALVIKLRPSRRLPGYARSHSLRHARKQAKSVLIDVSSLRVTRFLCLLITNAHTVLQVVDKVKVISLQHPRPTKFPINSLYPFLLLSLSFFFSTRSNAREQDVRKVVWSGRN